MKFDLTDEIREEMRLPVKDKYELILARSETLADGRQALVNELAGEAGIGEVWHGLVR